mmetsp:Transcript_27256/g.19665  ORF Transcript_27256/g.19665 Transcript_27256/m.19665 type:complete len:132 (+) Transcript_27256:204-599(+)|eukprot:CAMPEP_0116874354 /NCGR_PEP_ID=MMETSP0463-20121206/5794_1 /TAXON_ID=181622 /ORGANISM="Strombidinopsis sp, Strain SopsisLIS2011" /LENGTH=131 /DNA_ID=CAMNT_0004517871 /DNA_START=121 /DNA_END=516 /DNA_ORIENTATION=-
MRTVYEALGFEVRELIDKTNKEMQAAMAQLKEDIVKLGEQGQTVLLSSYFSGQGHEDGKGTLAVLNETGEEVGIENYANYIFNIEEQIKRNSLDHVYTITIFDCSREEVPRYAMIGDEPEYVPMQRVERFI